MTKTILTPEEKKEIRRKKNLEYQRRWRERNPDRVKAQRADYNRRNKERLSENYKRYYWLHHEEILAKAQAKRDEIKASRPPRKPRVKAPKVKKPITLEDMQARAEYMRRYRWEHRNDTKADYDYHDEILQERKEKEKRLGKDYRKKVMERCLQLASKISKTS